MRNSPISVWRKFKNRYRILGNICNKCNKSFYPPVLMCTNCGEDNLSEFEFSKKVKLVSWSTIYAPPKGFEKYTPYIVGIVELSNGERMTSQIVDCEEKDLKYDMKLKACFRKVYTSGDDGIIHYALKFKTI